MMRIRMKRAARQRAEQGIPKWKRAFGYLGDTYQPDPVTAPLVKQAYAAILAGGSITDIARACNTAGAHGLTGKPWTASTVSLFLRAPRNAGLRAHNDEIVGTGHLAAAGGRIHLAGSAVRAQRPRTRTWAQDGAPAPADRGAALRQVRCSGYLSGSGPQQQQAESPTPASNVGVSIHAEHVEPLRHGPGGRSAGPPDAVDLLKAELHDEAEAEAAARQKRHPGPAG